MYTYEVGVALQAWTTPAPTIRSRRAASFKVPQEQEQEQEQAQFCCALSYRTVPGPDDGSLHHLDDRHSAFVSFTCMHVASLFFCNAPGAKDPCTACMSLQASRFDRWTVSQIPTIDMDELAKVFSFLFYAKSIRESIHVPRTS